MSWRASLGVLAGAMALSLVALASPIGSAAAGKAKGGSARYYYVIPGDTLVSIAKSHGVGLMPLRRANPRAGRILQPGQKLRLPAGIVPLEHNRVVHVVRDGETASAIAKQHKVKLGALLVWNRLRRTTMLHVGDELIIYHRVKGNVGKAMGKPASGALLNGVPLPSSHGYRVVHPRRAYGTRYTIAQMVKVFGSLGRKVPPVAVADVSFQRGGYMSPHRSHQCGQDVDIAYYFKGRSQPKTLQRVTPSTMDVDRTFQLLDAFLKRSKVEYIFVDYALQRPLYEHAKTKGKKGKAWLEKHFQYPRGASAWVGVIRHSPGHKNHFHIRFAPEG